MCIMIERDVVFPISENSVQEKSEKTIWPQGQEISAREDDTKPFAEREAQFGTREMIPHDNDDFEKALGQWRKEYEAVYSAESTHEL